MRWGSGVKEGHPRGHSFELYDDCKYSGCCRFSRESDTEVIFRDEPYCGG